MHLAKPRFAVTWAAGASEGYRVVSDFEFVARGDHGPRSWSRLRIEAPPDESFTVGKA